MDATAMEPSAAVEATAVSPVEGAITTTASIGNRTPVKTPSIAIAVTSIAVPITSVAVPRPAIPTAAVPTSPVPRSGADKYTARKPCRAVIAIRSASVRIVSVISVGTARSDAVRANSNAHPDSTPRHSNPYRHLGLCGIERQN